MDLTQRNKELTNLHKVCDYLSRSLRENLKIFSVDSTNKNICFLSEKGNVISCNYDVESKKVILEDFNIEEANEFVSGDKLDSKVSHGLEEFLSSIRGDRFDTADVTFAHVLNLFEERSNLDKLRYRLTKHQDSFGKANIVVESSEFKKLEEVKEPLIAFIRENKEEILKNKDIVDCLGISNAITKAFTCEKVTHNELKEYDTFTLDLSKAEKSLYEMVCQQELVRQELMESKEAFSTVWIANEKIQKLASCIYSKEDAIKESLEEVIREVPYFSFATKADLQETLESIYEVNSTDVISKKDIKEFVKTLYEWKKPVKQELVRLLDEDYGINATNLKFVPTFSNVSKTHSVLFEVLSMFMEEGVLQDVVKDYSKVIAKKGGVEVLDSNDFIVECFQEAEAGGVNENLLMQYIDVPRLTKDLAALSTLIGGGAMMGGGMEGEGMEGEEMAPEEMEGEEEELEGGEFAPEDDPGTAEDVPMPGGPDGAMHAGVEEEPGEEDMDMAQEPPEEGFGGQPEEGGPEMPIEREDEEMPEDEEIPVGDDSTEEMPRPAAKTGGSLGSLVADLEKLVSSLGARKSRPMPPEQYEG